MNCPHCGSPHAYDASFCAVCGRPMSGSAGGPAPWSAQHYDSPSETLPPAVDPYAGHPLTTGDPIMPSSPPFAAYGSPTPPPPTYGPPGQPTSGHPGSGAGVPYPPPHMGQTDSGAGQPYSPYAGQPHPGQPHPGQPYPGQPHPGQPHFPGQAMPGAPYPGAPAPQYHPGAQGSNMQFSIVAYVLSVLALLFYPFPLGILAIVFARMAQRRAEPFSGFAVPAAVAATVIGIFLNFFWRHSLI